MPPHQKQVRAQALFWQVVKMRETGSSCVHRSVVAVDQGDLECLVHPKFILPQILSIC